MSENSKLFAIGSMEKVDIETGESVPVEGGQMRMLPGPKGSCEWCHVVHEKNFPHNQQSLPYQMKFHAINGRYPTWSDAMAHCSNEMKSEWKKQLIATMKKYDMIIPDDLKEDESV